MTAETSRKLARVLHDAGFITLAERAEADEFHDFLSRHADPAATLAALLANILGDRTYTERQRLAAHHIRQRLIDGEFDASNAESEEWAAGPEGQEAFARLARGE